MGQFHVEFVNNNSSTITIKAIYQDLNKGRTKQNRVFVDKSLEDVLKTLATSFNLSLNLDNALATKKISYYLQENKTDLTVLAELSEIYYAIANIKDKELVFISKSNPQTTLNIKDTEILSIHRYDTANKIYQGVKASYWDLCAGSKKELKLGTEPYLHLNNKYNQELLTELVKAKYQEIKEAEIIELVVVGNPNLQAGLQIQLNNIGLYQDFVGKYTINQAKHIFDGEYYSTRINAIKI